MKFCNERDLKIAKRLISYFNYLADYNDNHRGIHGYYDTTATLREMGTESDRSIALALIAIESLNSKEEELVEIFKSSILGDKQLKYLATKFGCSTGKITYHRDKLFKDLRHRYKVIFMDVDNTMGTTADWIYEAGMRAGYSMHLRAKNTVKNSINMDSSLAELEISVRTYNSLYRYNIKTVGDLVNYLESGKSLSVIRYLNDDRIEEIKNSLKKIGVLL